MDWVRKNKKTGEIVTILSMRSGSSNREIEFIGGDGITHTLEEGQFNKKFEEIDTDLSFIIPSILEGAKVDYELRSIVHQIARKCTPDYYKEGMLVYLSKYDEGTVELFGKVTGTSGIDYLVGKTIIFKIMEIEQNTYEPGVMWLGLQFWRGPGKLNESKDINYADLRVPVQLIRPFARDAARYLKRMDMPY